MATNKEIDLSTIESGFGENKSSLRNRLLDSSSSSSSLQSSSLSSSAVSASANAQNSNIDSEADRYRIEHERWLNRVKRTLFGAKVQNVGRVISVRGSGNVNPPNYLENVVRNQKYSVFSFVFIVLYNEFRFFFNLFFLLIAISQFIPQLQVGLLFTYIAPLALVLTLTMLKEAYDDFKRFQRDTEANSEIYQQNIFKNQEIEFKKGGTSFSWWLALNEQSITKINRVLEQSGGEENRGAEARSIELNGVGNRSAVGVIVPKKSSELKVGDIVQVSTNQRVPADLLLFETSDVSGDVFIKTDQLDGETDWKLRKPVRLARAAIQEVGIESMRSVHATVKIQEPIENIYKFQGVYIVNQADGTTQKESLSLENTLWANTVLASGKIWAMVVYAGKETRMAMNSRSARSKFGELDAELNYLSKLLFVFMLISSVVLVVLNGVRFEWNTLNLVFRYLLLLSSIIPISMRVNLDFAKLIYCYRINIDSEMPGTVARSSQIPEELGRIEFILTDKTGTLTQNDMSFKKLSLESGIYTHEDTQQLQNILRKQCKASLGPMEDVERILKRKKANESNAVVGSINGSINSSVKEKVNFRREKDAIIRDLVTALAVCHNVTPINSEDGQRTFQASSPDEVALVKIAENMGLTLENRSQEFITLVNANAQTERYQILANFPFSSQSKRMGIIVKQLETNRIIFYLKGADTVICDKVPKYQKGFLKDECDSLAREGLRTLVITQKYLPEDLYNEWNVRYQEARQSLENRDEREEEMVLQLEKDMEFLGITGVEDKLQEDVCNTLESLRNAGIKIWMLTGDKVETATCIAISAGIMSNPLKQFLIQEVDNSFNLQQLLQRFNSENNYVLIIDGASLKLALEKHENLFFEIATKAPAVVCCRCSPTQKAQITECIKKHTGKKTAGVGDGGNDVGMIQSADVGIGIVGKEGMQAALAADFSIEKFKYLNRLLLWHGRLSYKRSAVLSQFVIHRGLIISIIQMIFIVCFYFVPIPLYNGVLMLGYSTIFTMFPVFSLIFDQDIDEKTSMDYPPLYQSLQMGREMSTKTFLGWIWGSIIMVLSFMIFSDAFINIQTITYAALIISEILNVITSIHKIHIVMIISMISSIIIYGLTIYALKSSLLIESVVDMNFILKLLFITAVSWGPPFLFKKIMKKLDPSDYEKELINLLAHGKTNRSIPDIERIRDLLTNYHPLYDRYYLRPDALWQVCSTAHLVSYSANHIIYEQGDKGEQLYVVLSGRVGIYFPTEITQKFEDLRASLSNDLFTYSVEEYKKILQQIRWYERDSWFGEIGLLNHGAMHSIAITETPVHLMVINNKEYQRYFAEKELNFLKRKFKIFASNALADCSPAFQRFLYYMSGKASFKSKEKIQEEGLPVKDIYIIKSGEFAIYKYIYDSESMLEKQLNPLAHQSERQQFMRIRSKENTKYSKNSKLKVIQKYEIVGDMDAVSGNGCTYSCVCESFDGGTAMTIPASIYLHAVRTDKQFSQSFSKSLQAKIADFNELVFAISSQMQKFGDFFFFKARHEMHLETEKALEKHSKLLQIHKRHLQAEAGIAQQQQQQLTERAGEGGGVSAAGEKSDAIAYLDQKTVQSGGERTNLDDSVEFKSQSSLIYIKNGKKKIKSQFISSRDLSNQSINLSTGSASQQQLQHPQQPFLTAITAAAGQSQYPSNRYRQEKQLSVPKQQQMFNQQSKHQHSTSSTLLFTPNKQQANSATAKLLMPLEKSRQTGDEQDEGVKGGMSYFHMSNRNNAGQIGSSSCKQIFQSSPQLNLIKATQTLPSLNFSRIKQNQQQQLQTFPNESAKKSQEKLHNSVSIFLQEDKGEEDVEMKKQQIETIDDSVYYPRTERYVFDPLQSGVPISSTGLLEANANVVSNASRFKPSISAYMQQQQGRTRQSEERDAAGTTAISSENNQNSSKKNLSRRDSGRRSTMKSSLTQSQFQQFLGEENSGSKETEPIIVARGSNLITDPLLQKALEATALLRDEVMKEKDTINVSDLKSTGRNELKSLMEIQNLQKRMQERQDPTKYDSRMKAQKMRVLDFNIKLNEQKNMHLVLQQKQAIQRKQDALDLQKKKLMFQKNLNRLGFSETDVLSRTRSTLVVAAENNQKQQKVNPPSTHVLAQSERILIAPFDEGRESQHQRNNSGVIESNQKAQLELDIATASATTASAMTNRASIRLIESERFVRSSRDNNNNNNSTGGRTGAGGHIPSKSMTAMKSIFRQGMTIEETEEQVKDEKVDSNNNQEIKWFKMKDDYEDEAEKLPKLDFRNGNQKRSSEELSVLRIQKRASYISFNEVLESPVARAQINGLSKAQSQQSFSSSNNLQQQQSAQYQQQQSAGNRKRLSSGIDSEQSSPNTSRSNAGGNTNNAAVSPVRKVIHFGSAIAEYYAKKQSAETTELMSRKSVRNLPLLDSYASKLQVNLKRLFYLKLNEKYSEVAQTDMQSRIADNMLDDNTKAYLKNTKGIMPDKVVDLNYLYKWRKHAAGDNSNLIKNRAMHQAGLKLEGDHAVPEVERIDYFRDALPVAGFSVTKVNHVQRKLHAIDKRREAAQGMHESSVMNSATGTSANHNNYHPAHSHSYNHINIKHGHAEEGRQAFIDARIKSFQENMKAISKNSKKFAEKSFDEEQQDDDNRDGVVPVSQRGIAANEEESARKEKEAIRQAMRMQIATGTIGQDLEVTMKANQKKKSNNKRNYTEGDNEEGSVKEQMEELTHSIIQKYGLSSKFKVQKEVRNR